LDVEQNIEIRDKNGEVVATLKPIKKRILPGKTETLTSAWREIPVFGKFVATAAAEAGLHEPLVRKAEFWITPVFSSGTFH